MRTSLTLIFIFLSSSVLADASLIKVKLKQNYQNVYSWQADFTQTTFVELLNNTVDKKGHITIKKPGKLLIEYKDVIGKKYISNGQKLWLYVPGDAQVAVYPKLSKLVAKEALSFLEGLGDLDKEFIVSETAKLDPDRALFTSKALEILSLMPRDSASGLERILLGVDQKNVVSEMVLFNSSGNMTHYVFTNVQLNPNLNDEIFDFKTPAGVKEIKN